MPSIYYLLISILTMGWFLSPQVFASEKKPVKEPTYEDIQKILKVDFRNIKLPQKQWEELNRYKNTVVIPYFVSLKYSKAVIDSIRVVPRELYAYNYEEKKFYPNRIYPIGHVMGIGWGSTISPVNCMAFFTEVVKPQPEHTALEIGTGSGYQVALLAQLVKKVYSIEIREELANQVIKAMKNLGDQNVKYKVGDGYYGWKKYAPFDIILVTCQANHIPPPLIAQLRAGGRMVIPVGAAWKKQTVYLVTKTEDGKIKTRNLGPSMFIPMLTSYSKSKQIYRTKKESTEQ